MGVVLVRGSSDRVKLDWSGPGGCDGVAPDGMVYMLNSEQVRFEKRMFWAMLPDAETKDCPDEYTTGVSRGDARKVCEWHAWCRLVRDA